jgi:hypothetical protein
LRIRTIVAGIAALALLAGCGNSGGTTGTPTTGSPPPSTGTSGGAPKIQNPLDVKTFEADPCGAVTPAQVQAFGLSGVSGRTNPGAVGAACIWLGTSTPAKMSPGIAILPDGTSLSSIIAKKDSTYQVFEQLPDIQGYPAYIALVNDGRTSGSCEHLVGVSDQRTIGSTFQSSTGSAKFADPCRAAAEFADLAITTIKAGAK